MAAEAPAAIVVPHWGQAADGIPPTTPAWLQSMAREGSMMPSVGAETTPLMDDSAIRNANKMERILFPCRSSLVACFLSLVSENYVCYFTSDSQCNIARKGPGCRGPS